MQFLVETNQEVKFELTFQQFQFSTTFKQPRGHMT